MSNEGIQDSRFSSTLQDQSHTTLQLQCMEWMEKEEEEEEHTTLPRPTTLRKVEVRLDSSMSSSARRAETCRIDSDSSTNSDISSISI